VLQRTTPVSTALLAGLLLLVVGTSSQRGGVLAYGLVAGCNLGLSALALVLVYRSSRVIDFAQLQIGALGGVLFGEIIKHHAILRGLGLGCDGCPASAGASAAEYGLAAAGSMLLAPVLSLILYLGLLRPLVRTSRLVATVATLAAGTVLTWVAGVVAAGFDGQVASGLGAVENTTPPVDISLRVPGGAVLTFGMLLTIAVTLLAAGGILLFLRRARVGRAIRAAADNEERARSLGIRPLAVQAVVWTIAGLLAGLATTLEDMATGIGGPGGVGVPVLIVVLAAAVIASLESLPLALLAAVVLGVVQQAVIAGSLDPGLQDLVIFGVIVGVLLLRPRELTGRLAAAAGAWTSARETRPIPTVLRDLPPVRRLRRWTTGGVIVVALGLPFVLSPGDTGQASQYLVDAIVGLSILVLSGWAGQISLGQFGLAAVGAWVAAVLGGGAHMPFWLTVPIGAVAGALAALLVGLPALRLRGLYLAITTLAFAELAQTMLFGTKMGAQLLPQHLDAPSILGIDSGDERALYYMTLVIAVACAVAVLGIRRSRTGRALIAARENEQAVQSFGVNLTRARLQAFCASGFFAALAGGLFAYQVGGPSSGGFAPSFSVQLFLMAVVGGLGSVAGPFLGAAFLAIAVSILGEGSGSGALVAGGLLVLLLSAPGGLAQVVAATRDAFLRRVADRYHLDVPALRRAGSSGDGRVPLAPKLTGGGAAVFVPRRYRLEKRPPAPVRPGATS
jgi:branched-chain amino acid transport system permease protein